MARRAVVSALLLASAGVGTAAEAPAPVDAELLEFLGSLDIEDEEWREFLAERPVPAARPEAGKPAGNPPARKEEIKPVEAESGQQDKVKQP